MLWETWKKGFDAWEGATAKYLEGTLKNPVVLGPSGALLAGAMKTKAAYENAIATFWTNLGLPSRRDQERALHALNQMQSRLLDLEERLADLKAENAELRSPKKREGVARA